VGEADVCVDELIGDMTEEEREQYWKTQSSLSTVSATTPSFAEACQQLGYEPAHPSPFPDLWARRQAQHQKAGEVAAQEGDNAGEGAEGGIASVAIERIPEVLELNGWQVTGAAWALQQEHLPIRGGMIADDCGTGKTIIMLVVVLEQYRRAIRAHAGGATGPWKPTLIIAPPHVVDVWFQEVQRFFSSELEIWRFYETKDKVTNPAMKARTLPGTDQRLVAWLEENCKPDDPRTSAKIIVTAYETFTFRTLQEMAAGKAKGTLPDCSLLTLPLTDLGDSKTGPTPHDRARR
jgi:hypothetical protein